MNNVISQKLRTLLARSHELYTVNQKKRHRTLSHIFIKDWPIFSRSYCHAIRSAMDVILLSLRLSVCLWSVHCG